MSARSRTPSAPDPGGSYLVFYEPRLAWRRCFQDWYLPGISCRPAEMVTTETCAVRCTGALSPVRATSSTVRSCASTRRPSLHRAELASGRTHRRGRVNAPPSPSVRRTAPEPRAHGDLSGTALDGTGVAGHDGPDTMGIMTAQALML